MKRKLFGMLCLAAAGMLIACGSSSFQTDENTVYVTKKGNILGASIEDFNETYYVEEELKSYITESVEDYVDANGSGSVKLDSFSVSDAGDSGKKAQLYLDYMTDTDYAQFNGVEMYTGTVLEAQAAGYEFEQTFRKVENGTQGAEAGTEEILEQIDNKVVILGQEILLKVDGEILYVSDGNTEVTGKDTVKIFYDADSADAKPAYVIYTRERKH